MNQKIATIITPTQHLYLKYIDYSQLELIINKKKCPISKIVERLGEEGWIRKSTKEPLKFNEKEYHLYT